MRHTAYAREAQEALKEMVRDLSEFLGPINAGRSSGPPSRVLKDLRIIYFSLLGF